MLKILMWMSLCLLATLPGCAHAGGAVDVPVFDEATRAAHADLQRRMVELEGRFPPQRAAEYQATAVELLRRMADLDREHPKLYTLTRVVFSTQPEAKANFMDSFGSTGPGRIFGQGLIESDTNRPAEAVAAFEAARASYRALDHMAGVAYCEAWLVNRYADEKDFDAARGSAEVAHALFVQLGDTRSAGRALSSLGDIEAERERYDLALEYYRRALAEAEGRDDVDERIYFLESIGEAARKAEDFDRSVEALEAALGLREQSGQTLRQDDTLISLARTHDRAGRLELARATYERAISLTKEEGSGLLHAQTEYKVALEGYLEHDEFGEAAARFRETLRLFREPPRTPAKRTWELLTLVKLSTSLLRLSRLAEARQVAETGVQLARELGRPFDEARCRMNLVNVDYSEGRLTRALSEQRATLDLLPARQEKLVTLSLNNMAAIYHELGKRDLAQDYAERALEMALETPDVHHQALAQEQLAVLLAEDGQAEAALERQAEAVRLWTSLGDRRRIAISALNHALILDELDRGSDALSQVDRAIAGLRRVGNAEGQAQALNTKAGFLGTDGSPADRRRALTLFDKALEIAEERGLRDVAWDALAGRAATHAALGADDEARRDYGRAIAVLEGQRAAIETDELKFRFFATKTDVYDAALALELKVAGDVASAEAFELAERSRARSLLDLLAEAAHGLNASVPPELARREAELSDAVHASAAELAIAANPATTAAARDALRVAEEELGRFRIELRRAVPRYAELTYPQPVPLPDLRSQVLADGETLLSYYLGPRTSVLWAVRRDGVTQHLLPPRARIETMVAAYLDTVGRPAAALSGREAGGAEAEALAEALLPAGVAGDGERLLIAPDGPLHHLPFAGLVRGGQYLVEDHEIVVIPSATALQLMRSQPVKPATRGFLGVGAPATASERFPELPFSKAALEAIAGLFPRGQSVVLSGDAATREALDAEDLASFRFVHFATHGWLDPDDPGLSGLLLAPRPPETTDATDTGDASNAAKPADTEEPAEEFLFVGDVFALRMAPQLVVLAACQSGRGELLRGEGLISMSRAFLYAGARDLVVSQWNVNDRSTAEFMRALYARLVAGEEPPAALRATQLEFIHSDRSAQRQPYRWAPFVLIGS